jgi:hypothetical protein
MPKFEVIKNYNRILCQFNNRKHKFDPSSYEAWCLTCGIISEFAAKECANDIPSLDGQFKCSVCKIKEFMILKQITMEVIMIRMTIMYQMMMTIVIKSRLKTFYLCLLKWLAEVADYNYLLEENAEAEDLVVEANAEADVKSEHQEDIEDQEDIVDQDQDQDLVDQDLVDIEDIVEEECLE